MKKRNLIAGAVLAGIPLLSLVFFVVGCESESVTQTDIQVSPAYAEVSKARPSVRLSASGWSNYRWSLEGGNANGYLSASVGDSVVYTATRFTTNVTESIEQVVTVTADVVATTSTTTSGTNSTTTTSTPAYYTGTARIVHK